MHLGVNARPRRTTTAESNSAYSSTLTIGHSRLIANEAGPTFVQGVSMTRTRTLTAATLPLVADPPIAPTQHVEAGLVALNRNSRRPWPVRDAANQDSDVVPGHVVVGRKGDSPTMKASKTKPTMAILVPPLTNTAVGDVSPRPPLPANAGKRMLAVGTTIPRMRGTAVVRGMREALVVECVILVVEDTVLSQRMTLTMRKCAEDVGRLLALADLLDETSASEDLLLENGLGCQSREIGEAEVWNVCVVEGAIASMVL